MPYFTERAEDYITRRFFREAITEGEHQENAHFNMVAVPLNAKEAERILPWGMKLADPPTGTLYVTRFNKPNFTVVPYEEAAFWIHVKAPVGPGRLCCWMVVNDDTALIYGREVLALPKKMAEFEYKESDGTVETSVTRRGIKLFSLDFKRGQPQSPPKPILDRRLLHIGGIFQLVLYNTIWMVRGLERISEAYDAEAKLDLNESEFDPLYKLIAGEPTQATMAVLDLLATKTFLPVGITGPKWFSRNVSLRFR